MPEMSKSRRAIEKFRKTRTQIAAPFTLISRTAIVDYAQKRGRGVRVLLGDEFS